MTTCPECNRRAAYMAADPEMYRGDDTRCDAHRRAPTPRWRTAPPDVPGWWWRRTPSPQIVSIRTYSQADCADLAEIVRIGHTNGEWAGPLPEPEEAE